MRNLGVRSPKKKHHFGPPQHASVATVFSNFWRYEIRKLDRQCHKTMLHSLK